jgi:NADH-quinone oxidoreductase subunit A
MLWKKAARGEMMSTELVFSAAALIGLAALVPCLMVMTGILGPRSKGKVKNEAYESGIGPIIGTVDQKFSVKFYLLAILFLIFDIEAVFMYPWAVSVRELGWFGFTEMVVFMLLLLTGLIYILKKGVLNWR